MKLHKKLLCTAGIALLFTGTSLFAAEQSARDILNKAYEYIGSMDKYAFDAVIIDDELQDGEVTKKYRHDVSVKVDRPGKLRVDTKGDVKNRTNYLNDGLFTMIDHGFGYYGQLETPKTYVAFKSRVREVHVWIATGDKPLVINYSIIDTTTKSYSRINTSIHWNNNPKISDSDFIFVAPKNAAKISVESAN
jgi:hypothetical protein